MESTVKRPLKVGFVTSNFLQFVTIRHYALTLLTIGFYFERFDTSFVSQCDIAT